MSMSNLNSPVLGEKPGYGSAAGPAVYAVAPAGIQVTVQELMFVTRVTSIRERTGQVKCQILAAVVGDMPNVVRIAAMNPTGTVLAANIQAAAPLNDHIAAAIQAAAVPGNHTHNTTFGAGAVVNPGGTAAGPTLVDGAGTTVVGGGATGIQNAVHAYGASAPVPHTYAAGTIVPGGPATEVIAGTNLLVLGCIFDVEAVGI